MAGFAKKEKSECLQEVDQRDEIKNLGQRTEDWRPTDTAADLVLKASGWFIEYLLIENNDLEHMTDRGVGSSDEIDALLAAKFI